MPSGSCSVDGCEKPKLARGYCNAHYCRWRNHGDPLGGKKGPAVRRALDFPDGTRQCTTCGERKPLDEYHKDTRASLGRRAVCARCHTNQAQAWYQQNHDRQLQRSRAAYLRDVDKIRANDLKRYERDREKRIALATDQMHIRRARMRDARYVVGITHKRLRAKHGDTCCYCGITMAFGSAKGTRYNPDRATIEHIIPISAGGAHDWDNTTLCCRQCNIRKNKMSVEEFLTRLGQRALDGHAPTATRLAAPHPTLW